MKAFLVLPAERVVRQIDVEKGQSIVSIISAAAAERIQVAPSLDIWSDTNADTRGLSVFGIGQPEYLHAGNALVLGSASTAAPVEMQTILAMIRWTELQTSGEVGIGRQIADVYHNGLPILEVRDGERYLVFGTLSRKFISSCPPIEFRFSRQYAVEHCRSDKNEIGRTLVPVREIDAITAGLVK